MTQAELLDQHTYLMGGGDDVGVGLHCRTCDLGGAPIAYLLGISGGYPEGSGVTNVETIAALLDAGLAHLGRHPA